MNKSKKEILDEKVNDLIASADCSNVSWSAWELDFIESIKSIKEWDGDLTAKQEAKVLDLWEKL